MPILTPQERIGTTIAGKYHIDRILGRGGMSTVFAGVHSWTHRAVAIKILSHELAQEGDVAQMVLKEARAASQLNHPNVVDVLDMGREEDATVYLVLELLEGEPLSAKIKRRALDLREVRAYLLPVMNAVAIAHRRGVTHRDLKPANIFISLDDAGEVVPKLLDFGIAMVRGPDQGTTMSGAMLGTPRYMAPEQIRSVNVGPHSDVWSMGVILFRALTRQAPFDGDTATAVLAEVLTKQAPPVRSVRPNLPPEVADVIDRALRPEIADRYADMGAMADALRTALSLAKIDERDWETADTDASGQVGLGARRDTDLDVAALPRVAKPASEPPTTVAARPARRGPLGLPPRVLGAGLIGVAILLGAGLGVLALLAGGSSDDPVTELPVAQPPDSAESRASSPTAGPAQPAAIPGAAAAPSPATSDRATGQRAADPETGARAAASGIHTAGAGRPSTATSTGSTGSGSAGTGSTGGAGAADPTTDSARTGDTTAPAVEPATTRTAGRAASSSGSGTREGSGRRGTRGGAGARRGRSGSSTEVQRGTGGVPILR